MVKRIILAFVTVVLALSAADAQPRRTMSFDKGWKFLPGDPENASAVRYDDSSWRTLDIPHDWSIEGENLKDNPGRETVGFFPTGTGWYRKSFNLPGYDRKKQYSVEFDGVYMNSTVWLNGVCLGTWPYGYSSFSYDLTPYLKARGNVIAVRVDNSAQPNSRWYSGSGIYRHVRIVETASTHFDRWGVFNYTESISDSSAILRVEASLSIGEGQHGQLLIRHELLDRDGNVVAVSESGEGSQTLNVPEPVLWDLDNPYLYVLRSSICSSGKIIDRVENTVGIRTIEYPLDKGFLLNGKQIKMKGVNLHHDGGAVGAAVPERVWERRLEILKSGGCNAIRTAHNAPAPEFLDLCDRMGFLVMDEAFDQWVTGKNAYDYHCHFAEWHEPDLTAMVARDRNHPSVVMWSIGNEVKDQSNDVGLKAGAELISICHRLDPTRPVTSGNDEMASNNPASEEFLALFSDDIVGYNYPDRWRDRRELYYTRDKLAFPERRVVATESNGLGSIRGGEPKISIDVEQRWRHTLVNDYIIGDFMWTGIDYYGECRWPARGWSFGYLDNCGFKKDGFYFFKSIWTDEPVVHIAGNWNREGQEGEIVRVYCFSNCDSAELFVNGRSYGAKATELPRKGVDKSWNKYGPDKHFGTTADLHLCWDVEYVPGEIKVVGTKNGVKVEDVVRTTSSPVRLRASVDRSTFSADPSDVAHITVDVLDSDGNVCVRTDNLVRFKLSGGRLLGVENGDMYDLGSVKASERKAFAGKCLAIIAADKPGKVVVTVESDGLAGDTVVLEAR